MLLKIIHETNLHYTQPISESVMELRMAPRQEQDQHRLSFTLAIGPRTSVNSYFDWLGNTVHAFAVNNPHKQIRIVATSVVEIDRAQLDPEQCPDTWPLQPGSLDYTTFDYMNFDGPVVDCGQLHELVSHLHVEPGVKLGELAMRMLRLIDERFTYEKGVTNAASPITEIFEHGGGVCQDFSHLMIAMARALRIPARYVSGFIHRDGDRFRGYLQTHAWCELYFPSVGWLGFDPANQCIVGQYFVKVAIGRDFRDVPPNRGVYRGAADESISVEVQSIELPAIPWALVPERYDGISLEAPPPFHAENLEAITQQQQGQQQQEVNRTYKQQQHQQQQLGQQQQQQQTGFAGQSQSQSQQSTQQPKPM